VVDRISGRAPELRATVVAVLGALVFMVAMVLVMPVGVMLAGALWSALLGELMIASTGPSHPDH
jgi:hypothetical protein